jgi:predicted acylesterase/phospholipase RssA
MASVIRFPSAQSARAASAAARKPRIALSLAGGGPLGAIYEIGALCALQEALDGVDFTRLDHYIGVSAGSFIAASLANGMSPQDLCKSFIDNTEAEVNSAQHSDRFDPAWLMRPAFGEFARRAIMFPSLLTSAIWRATVERKSIVSALELLGPALPTGIFSSKEVNERMATIFSQPGRSNDFRALQKMRGSRLTVVATNLDSGESAPFGSPGWDHVPISQAVQASSALPGLFPPVEIGEHYFVDGALKKTLHASVALDDGMDLMICLNPLVPFDALNARPTVMQRGLPKERQRIPRITDGGLPAVLSQTFRSMIHSRLEMGMKAYERQYPQTDIVLIEPDQRDPEMYLANTFSYSQRASLAEHAYQQTRHLLRARRSSLTAKFEKHGIVVNDAVLNDTKRHLVMPMPKATAVGKAVQRLEETLEDLERQYA